MSPSTDRIEEIVLGTAGAGRRAVERRGVRRLVRGGAEGVVRPRGARAGQITTGRAHCLRGLDRANGPERLLSFRWRLPPVNRRSIPPGAGHSVSSAEAGGGCPRHRVRLRQGAGVASRDSVPDEQRRVGRADAAHLQACRRVVRRRRRGPGAGRCEPRRRSSRRSGTRRACASSPCCAPAGRCRSRTSRPERRSPGRR